MRTRRERVLRVVTEAPPGTTIEEMAEQAGVNERTIRRTQEKLLQNRTGVQNCNKERPPYPDLEDADPDIRAWIETFYAWPMAKKKQAYGIFLKQTGVYGL